MATATSWPAARNPSTTVSATVTDPPNEYAGAKYGMHSRSRKVAGV